MWRLPADWEGTAGSAERRQVGRPWHRAHGCCRPSRRRLIAHRPAAAASESPCRALCRLRHPAPPLGSRPYPALTGACGCWWCARQTAASAGRGEGPAARCWMQTQTQAGRHACRSRCAQRSAQMSSAQPWGEPRRACCAQPSPPLPLGCPPPLTRYSSSRAWEQPRTGKGGKTEKP